MVSAFLVCGRGCAPIREDGRRGKGAVAEDRWPSDALERDFKWDLASLPNCESGGLVVDAFVRRNQVPSALVRASRSRDISRFALTFQEDSNLEGPEVFCDRWLVRSQEQYDMTGDAVLWISV